jgi:hypothetical protein
MAKVGVKIGLTLKLSKDNDFQFIRPEISIEEIDTDKPLQPQIDLAVSAIKPVFDAVTQGINEKVIAEMPNVSKDMEALVITRMREFRARLEGVESQVKGMMIK